MYDARDERCPGLTMPERCKARKVQCPKGAMPERCNARKVQCPKGAMPQRCGGRREQTSQAQVDQRQRQIMIQRRRAKNDIRAVIWTDGLNGHVPVYNNSSPRSSISLSYHPVPSLKSVSTPSVHSQANTTPVRDPAKRFFDTIVKLHRLPQVIISDRHAAFTSMFWTSLMRRFGIKLTMCTAYQPQTDGQSERMDRTMKEMLRHYIAHNQKDWTNYLSSIEFAYNNAIHPSTGMTPVDLDVG
jgi:hypothetical protein